MLSNVLQGTIEEMLKYRLKWETPFKTGIELPIRRRLKLGGNKMKLAHVQGDSYTDMDTATLLTNYDKLKHGPSEGRTPWVHALKSVLLLPLILTVTLSSPQSKSQSAA